MIKQPLSTKVPAELKANIEKKAKEKNMTLSNYVEGILVSAFEPDEERERLEQELSRKKNEIEEKNKLVERLTANLEKEQQLLGQQQELQLMAQRQLELLQRSQEMLIESQAEHKRWWQIWK